MIFKRLCLTLALVVYSAAGTGEWRSVPADSRLRFTATYEGQAVPGEIGRFEVRLELEPERPEDGRLVVTVDLTSTEMGNDDLNERIRRPEWLHVERHQEAVFRSDRIRVLGEGRYRADGTLALKGRTRPLQVPFRWHTSGDAARMSGRFSLSRARFGIGTGDGAQGSDVGLDVAVSFSVQLERRPAPR